MCVFCGDYDGTFFILFISKKKKASLLISCYVFFNALAVSQREYAVNLISFFIILFWGGILSADMHSDKDTEE